MSLANQPAGRLPIDTFAAGATVLLCLLWALNQVAVKLANAGIQPVFQAGLRSLLAVALVLAWCRLRRVRIFDRDGTLVAGLLAGVLFSGEFLCYFIALDHTNVSRATIFFYTTPLFVAIGAHFLIPGERLTPLRAAGSMLAFSGIVVAFIDAEQISSSSTLFGDLLSLLAASLWAATSLLIKTTRLRVANAEKVFLYQLSVSAVLLLAISPAFGPFLRDLDLLAAGAFAFQVVIVVSMSYLAWFWLLLRYPASQLASFTFFTPIFGVLLGAVLLDEPVDARLFVALFLVAAGVYLVNRPRTA